MCGAGKKFNYILFGLVCSHFVSANVRAFAFHSPEHIKGFYIILFSLIGIYCIGCAGYEYDKV